jgi:hypothetical protein
MCLKYPAALFQGSDFCNVSASGKIRYFSYGYLTVVLHSYCTLILHTVYALTRARLILLQGPNLLKIESILIGGVCGEISNKNC